MSQALLNQLQAKLEANELAIQDALGTEEKGASLVEVARNAHKAEQAYAALVHKYELALQDGEPALVLEESAKLAVPTVHMNGTSKKELLEQYKNAFTAVTTAVTELCKSSPHARDYYTQKGDQYPVARKQHESRLKRLNSVAAELESIAVAIIEQGGRN